MKTVSPAIGSLRYTNIALSVVAVMLTLLVADRFVGVTAAGGMSVAQAAPEEITERANALEQNKQMIAELRAINTKLDRLTSSIKSPMPVKVTELPAGFVQNAPKKYDIRAPVNASLPRVETEFPCDTQLSQTTVPTCIHPGRNSHYSGHSRNCRRDGYSVDG